MKAPCYQCPDRHDGCHAECKRYAAYREERDKDIAERAKRVPMDAYTFDVIQKNKKEARK